MTKQKLNIIICIMVFFVAFFFAGSYAYNDYKMRLSDEQAASRQESDLAEIEEDNKSGLVNEEIGNI